MRRNKPPNSPPPHLLDTRIARLRRALPGVARRKPSAIHAARTATRRLREIVPLMGLEPHEARKLVRRLRKVGRRLGNVRDLDTRAKLLDKILRLERTPLLRALRDAVGPRADRQWHETPPAKVVARLERIIKQLSAVADTPRTAHAHRAVRWAAQARVARRSREARDAARNAGAIYEPEQLHHVRIAVKKLRYSAEVAADAGGPVQPADIALLKRVQNILGRQHDAQVLIDHVRDAERTLGRASVATWRETERVIALLEARCHRLHARFLRERAELLEVCDRIGGIGGSVAARRKAS